MELPTPRRAACCAWVTNARLFGRPVRRWARHSTQLCIAQWGTTRAWRCARLITCSGGLRRAPTGWTASPRGARACASSPLALAPARKRAHFSHPSSPSLATTDTTFSTINLIRDPRWGRIQETASEDPFLNGIFAREITRGLQEGEDPRFLLVAACLKHFAV